LAGLTNENTERPITEIAKALQMDSAEAEQLVSSVYSSYYDNTARQIEEASGLDGYEVLQRIEQVLSPQERSSLASRVYYGDKSVINDLISKYR